jgi:DNA primase
LDGVKQIRFLLLPDKFDPDAFVRANGTQAFLTLKERAMSLYDFIFFKLTLDLELEHIEGKTALISRLKPIVQNIQVTYIKDLLLTRLAQITKVEKQILQQEYASAQATASQYGVAPRWPAPNAFRGGSSQRGTTTTSARSSVYTSSAARTTALLLYHRQLLPYITSEILALLQHEILQNSSGDGSGSSGNHSIKDYKLLSAVSTLLLANPELTLEEIGQLLPTDCVKFFNPKEFLVMIELIPKDGVESEFLHNLETLKQQYARGKLDEMLLLAKSSELTQEQKQELQELLAQKR